MIKSMLKIKLSFVIFFHCCISHAEESIPLGRLPKDVHPERYELSLTINPELKTFSGVAGIHLNLGKSTRVIWLHGRDLKVEMASIVLPDQKVLQAKYTLVDESGVVRIDVDHEIPAGKAILKIVYEAPFNERLEGLYRVEESGKAYAFTQFEAISARLCFPSFDEPSFKTPFDIELTVKKEHSAITNTMPVEEQDAGNGMKRLRFARTEKLPSYLVAFAVGPFDVVEGPAIPANELRQKPVPLRGVAVRGKGNQFQFALQNTGKILEAFERYFGSGYAFGKIDLIAVPDFEWGAMENAGAITFREELLLMDEKNAPIDQKKSFAIVMAHELAHQWLGNVVTLEWWDDIWLNEGLTSWVEGQITEELYPEFQSRLSDVLGKFRVMDIDSTSASHPIREPVENAKEIRSIGDAIIFTKGSSVTEMYEHFIGKEKFQQILRKHVQKHRFGNANTEDFLKTVKEISGDGMANSFRSFILQEGVPYVDITAECGGKEHSIHIKQNRYLPLGATVEAGQKWMIPVCLRFGLQGKSVERCEIMTPDSQFVFSKEGCAEWIMPNSGAFGYYRWNLSSAELRKLREHGLAHLNPAEQLAVIDSIEASFDKGVIQSAEALDTVSAFVTSTVREIAMSPVSLYQFFRNYLYTPEQVIELEKRGRDWYRPVYQRLKFDPAPEDSVEQKLFRRDVIEFLALDAMDPEVRSIARERGVKFAGYKNDHKLHPDAIDSDLVEIALSVAAQEEDIEFLKLLIGHLKGSDDSLFRRQILSAIGHVREPQKVQAVLQLSIDPALRTNEVRYPLFALMSEKENWEAVWKFVTSNYDTIASKMPTVSSSDIAGIGRYFCSEEKEAEVNAFFEKRIEAMPSGVRNLNRTLDNIRICASKLNHYNEPQSRP